MFRNRFPRGTKAGPSNLPTITDKDRQDNSSDNKLRINHDTHTTYHDQRHRKANRPLDEATKQRNKTGKKDQLKGNYGEDISHIGGTLRDPSVERHANQPRHFRMFCHILTH